MSAFRFIPHTADVRLQVAGNSVEDLFRSALLGMAFLQKRDFCIGQKGIFSRQDDLKLKAVDLTVLLIDFLSEVLTLSQINKTVYCDVKFKHLTETTLTAIISGSQLDYFDEDIKAVTYHEAEIKHNAKKELETIIVFDI